MAMLGFSGGRNCVQQERRVLGLAAVHVLVLLLALVAGPPMMRVIWEGEREEDARRAVEREERCADEEKGGVLLP